MDCSSYKSYSIQELYVRLKYDDESLFVAFIANNLNYVAVNAFIHKLHNEDGIDHVSGIVVNLRNDPNVGHSFALDSFRFPHFSNIEVVYLNDEYSTSGERKIIKIWRYVIGRLSVKKRNRLYFISDSTNISAHIALVYMTGRRIIHVLTSEGLLLPSNIEGIKLFLREKILITAERIFAGNVISFRPFQPLPRLKRCRHFERFYKKATEDEHLILSEINYNRKYVLFISQNGVYKEYNSVVERVLEAERLKGFDIYIKPHSHERTPQYPQNDNYHILPRDYAIESIVGSAPRRPDKIISVVSTSLITCSAWFEVPCYTILDAMSYKELNKDCRQFLKIVRRGEYPYLYLSKNLSKEN